MAGQSAASRAQRLLARLVWIRTTTWSWLVDPAVLVYRRHGFGQKRARVIIVEFFLFVREVVREFWNIEGTSRAASLAFPLAAAAYLAHGAMTSGVDQIAFANMDAFTGYALGIAAFGVAFAAGFIIAKLARSGDK